MAYFEGIYTKLKTCWHTSGKGKIAAGIVEKNCRGTCRTSGDISGRSNVCLVELSWTLVYDRPAHEFSQRLGACASTVDSKKFVPHEMAVLSGVMD